MSAQPPVKTLSAHAARYWLAGALQLLIALAVAAGFVALWWVDTLPQRVDEQQTIVIGPTRFAPDSDGAVRVVVQDLAVGRPIAGAHVQLSLKPATGRAISLYEGETDASGSLPVSFHIPADAPAAAMLVVETESQAGRDRLEQPVTIQREYRLLLTTDKPLYQPGQTIHIRVLALGTFDLVPARGATVNFLVEDARGNKVFRQSVTASDYGIAAADFALADIVNQGNYRISAAIGETESEKTVEVRPYVLPKFAVNVTTDRAFYLPGQRVAGVVQADYFFGKPVAHGQVHVLGSVWDVERTVVVDVQGQTDENGTHEFAFDLPEYFAGSGLESGQAQFALEVTVVDQTDHAEQTSAVLPVAAQPIVIEAVPESGVLKPGVENVVYILTSYPDGRPAPTHLQIRVDGGEAIELSTGTFGLAEFAFTPRAGYPHTLDITAQNEAGWTARRQVSFETEYDHDSVLLRADRAAYVVGETMNLIAFTPVEYGNIYLDIVRAGQTLATRSARVAGGKAEFAVDVTPDLYGTLELHAYKVLLDGTIVRDTRLVVVDAPNALAIDVTTDRETYLPGDTATIDFGVQGSGGTKVQAALGVAIVDESVFALQQQDPGFAKLYFLLEQDLLEPRYQIKSFELPAAIEEEPVREAQDTAARAAWAGATVQVANPINSHPAKLSAAQVAQVLGTARIGLMSAIGMILTPLALWAVALAALWRSGVMQHALGRTAAAIGILLIGGGILACMLMSASFFYEAEQVLIPLASALGLSALVLLVHAWDKRDTAAQLLALLTLAWGALLFLMIRAAERGGEPTGDLIALVFLAYLLIPGAYLFFGQGRWLQARRFSGVLSTSVGAFSALPALVILATLISLVKGYAVPTPVARQEIIEVTREVELVVQATTAAPMEEAAETNRLGEAAEQSVREAPRLRQWFPETLYWAPEIVTDENGNALLQVPMADSITTWRLTALASAQDGRLGFTTHRLRAFQDFFVDIDLPLTLTQGDEISIPVGVFNYLPDAQEVRLVVQEEPWFQLPGPAEQTLTIAPNDVEVVYFPIHVVKFGRHGFQVTAWGAQMSDAIRREVNVVPDGRELWLSESNYLRESREIELAIPPAAIPDTPYVEVKVYPGVLSQVVEGLEKILQLPFG